MVLSKCLPRVGNAINDIACHRAVSGSLGDEERSGGVDGREEHVELD